MGNMPWYHGYENRCNRNELANKLTLLSYYYTAAEEDAFTMLTILARSLVGMLPYTGK